MTEAQAVTEDGREVLITQDPAGLLTYFVADDRFLDGWRQVDTGDEVAELTASINRAQAARTEAEVGREEPAPEPPTTGSDDAP